MRRWTASNTSSSAAAADGCSVGVWAVAIGRFKHRIDLF
jgi:hypothetical protein